MASTYDKASLVMIPSGTKASKIFSQKPVNGDGDFTFSRSTAATRVNADGNIEKETQNLLLQSNSFDTSWSNFNLTLTGSQAGYDGSNDAWKLTAVGTGGGRKVQQANTSSGVLSFSVYAKAGTANYIALECGGTGGFYEYFNLTDGTDGAGVGNIDVNAEDVGNGWWRFTIVGNPSGLSSVNIFASNTNNATDISDGQYIYIQDAQLNQGLIAQEVITTTTAAVEGGITDNVPRLDYTDSSCPALLLEPQRTNIVPNSEYVNAMTLQNISATANATTSPEGVGNAYEVEPTGTGFKTIGNFISVTANLTYTISFFYKNVDHKNIGFYDNNTSGSEIQINVQDNTFTLGSNVINGNVEDYGNGWYRAYATFVASSGTLANYLIFRNDSNNGSYTATGSSIYVYGFQVEAGSYATSYIPTYGTSVTRNADSCSKTGISSLIGQTEGTMYAEFEWEQKSGVYFVSDLSTGSTSNEILVAIGNTADNRIRFQIQNSGIDQVNFNSGVISSGTHKVALAYKANEVVAYLDGVQIGTDTSCTIPATSRYAFERANGTLGYEGGIKQALLFKTRLSNEELAALTTI